jgi:hypothetical protein
VVWVGDLSVNPYRLNRKENARMGFLKSMKDAVGQAQEAAAATAQWQQKGDGAPAAMDVSGAPASRGSLESQAHEQNRILSVGHAGTALIRGHVDTGENIAGNPVWIFDLEITPDGGAAYAVQHREMVSSMATGSYGDGTSLPCRIDPADPQKIAFGEKPFMKR